ncbi:MAG TPA: hypothetical protein VGN44_01345 [Candidatus Angelobacter sp.]|jgi:predicted GNAT family acetyltransferase
MLKLRTALPIIALFSVAFLHAQPTDKPVSDSNVTIRSSIPQRIATGLSASLNTFYAPAGPLGQPFSADTVEETDQTLADGNHIHRESHGKIFRDSQGRTRTEFDTMNLVTGTSSITHVFIMDPVEGRTISLDLELKAAIINHFKSHSANAGSGTTAKPSVSMAAAPNRATALAASTGYVGGGLAELGKRSSEDIGTMTVEGFTVTGTRTLLTMPAGSMGNDKPIITTIEHWYSPDLKMVLLNSSENPESGKNLYKLINIHSGNPDPLLFQVPADFEVKENPQR